MIYIGYHFETGCITLKNGNVVKGVIISKDNRKTIAADSEIAKRYVDSITMKEGNNND